MLKGCRTREDEGEDDEEAKQNAETLKN